jgi:SAM-dependent methyltransferase
MNRIRELWEVRARELGVSCRSVLFKGFSEPANAVLDGWHKRLVREIFEPEVPAHSVVLDIGCGYGRLTRLLAEDRPDIVPIGQDISFSYCAFLIKAGGIAIQGDQGQLPFKPGSLGGALAVTTMMYADRDTVVEILRQIRVALRPGAPLLIVDPGEEMRSKIERLGRHRVATATGGRGFLRDEYRELALAAGFHVVRAGGNPRDSMLFLLTLGGKFGWQFAKRILSRDGVAGGYSALALHRFLLLRAPAVEAGPEKPA